MITTFWLLLRYSKLIVNWKLLMSINHDGDLYHKFMLN